ncbi:hypothetical protein CJP16_13665 [Aeromonas sobria]|uniref:Uncharacterized protein n=1 Tax=Aeromonas sobria TaxID=646 RepID=A0A2N3IVN1_AERSO|nr:hypothetical protein CJP16_13665 [Aeromonas sobria]
MVTVDDYASLIDPTCILTLPLSRKGRGMVTADDYAALIDPTFILHPTALPQGEGGWLPRTITLR